MMLRMSVIEGVQAAQARLDAAVALGAVVCRDDQAALAQAAALDAEVPRRQLAGLAITIKDWIDVAGLACEGEALERTGRMPERDATAVARLRAAGAIVIAKTQPGAEHPIHGRCHHPLDAERTPGGSSSGEAALIGAGASLVGLGSDSGGSIRLPAAWCGVFGFKPSFGLVPNTGHFPRVGGRHDGRTVIGPLAASAADLLTIMSVICGPDGVDPDCVPVPLRAPSSVDPRGLRVAVVEEAAWAPAGSTRAAVQAAVSHLADLGCVIVDEPLPAHLDEALDITLRYWGRSALSGAAADRPGGRAGSRARPLGSTSAAAGGGPTSPRCIDRWRVTTTCSRCPGASPAGRPSAFLPGPTPPPSCRWQCRWLHPAGTTTSCSQLRRGSGLGRSRRRPTPADAACRRGYGSSSFIAPANESTSTKKNAAIAASASSGPRNR